MESRGVRFGAGWQWRRTEEQGAPLPPDDETAHWLVRFRDEPLDHNRSECIGQITAAIPDIERAGRHSFGGEEEQTRSSFMTRNLRSAKTCGLATWAERSVGQILSFGSASTRSCRTIGCGFVLARFRSRPSASCAGPLCHACADPVPADHLADLVLRPQAAGRRLYLSGEPWEEM